MSAPLSLLLLCISAHACSGLVVPLTGPKPAVSLDGISLCRVSDGKQVNLGPALEPAKGKTLLVLGTHPADFNMIEYSQRVRTFWPQLKEKGVDRCMMVVNGEAPAINKLKELLDIPDEIELLADPTGETGRKFGVSRGFRPNDTSLPPALKLFLMATGLAFDWTLPSVILGYVGNPGGKREWIEAALQQGQLAGRWPAPLTLADDGAVLANQFDTTPLVGGWGVRPFELATLRLQNLIGVQFTHKDALKYSDARCLTQLGGCT
ncbi:hypothetical protein T484DRAFT_1912150, partial [Baffinella frigidus]